jgi:hypothetical protein
VKLECFIIWALRIKSHLKVNLIAKVMGNKSSPENLDPKELASTLFLLLGFVLDDIPLCWVLVILEQRFELNELLGRVAQVHMIKCCCV